MAGRASIVGAAATHVGKVREHNEDSHFIDVDLGLFLVCDGMGGHAAGEVASELAIRSIRTAWASEALSDVAERWLERGTPDAKKRLLDVVRSGVLAAHDAILAEADRDDSKSGMGTTLVGAMVVGGELVFAHAGDSRAYLVRDGISMQLTEDHTLLARLLAAGIEVDVSGEGSRFRSMLTNALGIGEEVKVSTFVVPLADGDRFLLCSDGISEYVPENEVGEVLTKQPSPARAAQRLIDLALERGGGDNATAVVVRVLEAGETPLPAEQRKRDDLAIGSCALWSKRVTPQQRLRALRIAIPRDHNFGEKLPPHALGDRVAWIIVEGELVQDGAKLGPGALVYPESLIGAGEAAPLPDRDALAITRSDVRALAIRADDFRELCDDDGELGETLLESLAQVIARRTPREAATMAMPVIDPRGNTDPQMRPVGRADVAAAYHPTDPNMRAVDVDERDRAATVPDEPPVTEAPPTRRPAVESPVIAPAPPRTPVAQAPVRPSPPPPRLTRATPSGVPARPSPLPAQMSARAPGRLTPPPPPGAASQSAASPTSAASSSGAPQPPSRPSPPPAASQPPSRPSAPPSASPSSGVPQPPSRPSPPPATMSPRATPPPAPQPPSRPSPPPATMSPRATPPTGRPAAPQRPTPVPAQAQDAAKSPPRGFAPALEPPGPPERPSSPPGPPGPSERPSSPPLPRTATSRRRPPTDPEIETYLEIEADLPPESGIDPELESELALSIALSGDLEAVHESVSITIEDGSSTRVTERVTETDSQTLTLTMKEPVADDAVRPRAITADDAASVSGTISISEDGVPARRPKRQSEGWDD